MIKIKKNIFVIFITIIILNTYTTSFASIYRSLNEYKEKIIPINIVSQTLKTDEIIKLYKYKNAQVLDIHIDDGEIEKIEQDEEILKLYFTNGTYSAESQIIENIETATINQMESNNGIITLTPPIIKDGLTEVIDARGNFSKQDVNVDKGNLVIDTSNINGERINSSKYNIKKIKFTVDENNKDKQYLSNEIILPQNADMDSLEFIQNLTSGEVEFDVNCNTVRAIFSNGNPIKKEKTSTVIYHPYQWIDRFISGDFKDYYPSSYYWSPRKSFSDIRGQYVYSALNKTISKESLGWGNYDYWEYEINNKRYSQDSGSNEFLDMNGGFNTERLIVDIDKNNIKINREGRLKSIENGFGSEYPLDKTKESTETFYNSNTGKNEYYVRHLRFFYGPNINMYAGMYTYPYDGGIEAQYKEYEQKEVYSGDITYKYKTTQTKSGYAYNGWLKIKYLDDRSVEDMPPSKPSTIIATDTKIIHGPSTDDYTPQSEIIYKYYYYKNDVWNYIGEGYPGVTEYDWNISNYGLDKENFKIGVVANDKYQDGEMGISQTIANIKLSGEINPTIVPAGDELQIDTKTEAYPSVSTCTYRIKDTTIEGILEWIKSEYPETWLYHLNGAPNSYLTGLVKYPNEDEYIIMKNKILKNSNETVSKYGNDDTDKLYFLANDISNVDNPDFLFGNVGTVILPSVAQLDHLSAGKYNAVEIFTDKGTMIRYFATTTAGGTNSYFIDAFGSMDWRGASEVGRIKLNRADVPLAIIYKGNEAEIYQAGEVIATVDLTNKMPENTKFLYIKFQRSLGNYLAAPGKYLFSKSIWKYDEIDTFINAVYSDDTWTETINGRYYIVANVNDYSDFLPTSDLWQGNVNLPNDIADKEYVAEVQAYNGISKSIDLPFLVTTPINPNGNIPSTMFIGKTYEATAISTKYTNRMCLEIFGNTIEMVYVGNDGESKIWQCSFDVPQNAGEYSLAEFTGFIPSGRSETDIKQFNIAVNAFVTGNNAKSRVGETVKITANTYGYCKQTVLEIFGEKVNMNPQKETTNYDNVWHINYTIPSSKQEGTYEISFETTNGIVIANDKKEIIIIDDRVKINSIKVGRVYKNDDTEMIEELVECGSTRQSNTEGFICAGHVLAVKVNFENEPDSVFIDIEGDESIRTATKLTKEFEEIEAIQNFPARLHKTNGNYLFYYTIPYETTQTLHSWSTLRKISKDGFKIDTTKLLDRIENPYKIKIMAYKGEEEITEEIEIDVFERWDKLINRDLSSKTYNYNKKKSQELSEWEK